MQPIELAREATGKRSFSLDELLQEPRWSVMNACFWEEILADLVHQARRRSRKKPGFWPDLKFHEPEASE